MIKFNLGSGPDYREGYFNVDLAGKCDKVYDLRKYPWPWGEGQCEEILALDIVEHLQDTLAFMNECWRISKVGGKLIIRTPSYDAPFAWTDPTHVKVFTIDSFDFFDPETDYGKYNSHIINRKWKVIKKTKTNNNNLEIEMEKI